MSSLRDQFKATALSDLENQQKEFESKFGKGGGDYLNLEVGKNKVRIFPKHPGEGAMFIYPKGVHFLPLERVGDDGKKTVSRRPVWSGLYHSEHKRCIIDEYISSVYTMSRSITDKKQRDSFLERLTGMSGIGMSRTWPVYANLMRGTSKKFGILELKNSVKTAMNSLAANLDDGSSMITTDPYTDPDTGRCIFVTYDNNAKKAEDYYKTGIDILGPTRLTDQELEEFSKQTPLHDLYVNTYKRSDFLLALEGLKRFDEEADDYNIFSHETWQDKVEEFSSLYPEEGEESDEPETPVKKEPTKVSTATKATAPAKPAPAKKPEGPKSVGEMDMDEILEYIRVNKLQVRPLPTDTVEDLRGLIEREEYLSANRVESKQVEEEADPVDNPLAFLKGKL